MIQKQNIIIEITEIAQSHTYGILHTPYSMSPFAGEVITLSDKLPQ